MAAKALRWLALGVVLGAALAGDTRRESPKDLAGRAAELVRPIEFDFVRWTAQAVVFKARQLGAGEQQFLDDAARAERVRQFFDLRGQLESVERAIASLYADPSVADPAAASADLRRQADGLGAQIARLQPSAEAILEEQLAAVLADHGLTLGGQPLPPVAFHITPLPLAMIVSRRDQITREATLILIGGLTLDEQVAWEARVAEALDVSSLVTPIGGLGLYPTMVAQSSDQNWAASVIAHEWAHNHLFFRPLGFNYSASSEMWTMNETTASIVGEIVGQTLMERYYADLARAPAPFRNYLPRDVPPPRPDQPPAFDFRAEMRLTRVRVDELLAQGRIEEAEAYMEARRRVFWQNGYQIRRLNQAYFAFHGSYAADPGGGQAGADPVGPAVRLAYRRSADLGQFVNTMAGFDSFAELQVYLGLVD